MLVVEAQSVHDLMEGPPGAAETVAVLGVWLLQGELLPAALMPDVRPTSGIEENISETLRAGAGGRPGQGKS